MSRQEATPASRLSQGRVIIESLGVYLPAGSVSTAELVRGCRSRVLLPLERLTGIRSRHVAAPDEFCIDIAAAAVRDCLAGSRHKADEIDLLISCSIDHCEGPQHRHSLEPNTSLQLRERLALANATAFDVSNGCAGMFTGIKVAEAFLKAGTSCCALVVSGEFISHLATTAQREISTLDDQRLACLTLGDAGAAVILEMSEDGEAGFESIDMHTVSKYSSYCIAKPSREPEGGVIMLTDAIRLSTTTVEHAIPHAAAALRRQDWRVDDLQHVIVHQTSRMSIQQAAQRISAFLGQRLPQSVNIADILEDHGNTATTSHFVALYDLMEKSRLHSGDRVLFSTTGSGLTIGTALYTFDDMPERGRARRTSVNGSASSRPRSASESSNGNHKGAGLAGVRIETVATASANASTDWGTALARRAAEDCMANSSHGSGEIALLVHCGVYRPEYMFEPAMAAMLADELHLNEEPLTEDSPRTLAFDVYNSSIGFLNACQVAGHLLSHDEREAALIVAAESDSEPGAGELRARGIAPTASAVILERRDDDVGFGTFTFRCFPEHADALVSYGYIDEGKPRLVVEKKHELHGHLLSCIRTAIHEHLEHDRLSLSDIALIIPPQMGSSFPSAVASALGVDRRRVLTVVDERSPGEDLFTSSVPYAFAAIERRRLATPGDIGLLVAAGAGLQIACATYRW